MFCQDPKGPHPQQSILTLTRYQQGKLKGTLPIIYFVYIILYNVYINSLIIELIIVTV